MLDFFKKKKKYIALIFFILTWGWILGASGSIFSGYHFTDDHEIVRIKHDLKSQSTLAVASNWMKRDQIHTHRFRPFYFLHRILEVRIFGSNFTVWSLYTAILAIATSFLLFCFILSLRFSFWEALLFSLITLVGPQADIWWRLGPNETIGMFMLALALFFLGMYKVSKKYEITSKILFIVFAILATLSKESFILVLPVLMFVLIYLTKEKEKISWQKSINKNFISLGVLGAVFVSCLLYIKTYIGIGGVGYAGIDVFSLGKYFKTFLSLSTRGWIGYFILVQLFFLMFFIVKEKEWKESAKNFLKKSILPVLIFLTIILPQVFLYTKSGFMKRYLLPSMLGYAFIFILLLREVRRKSKIIWFGIFVIVLILVWGNARNDFKDAKSFYRVGKTTGEVFKVIKNRTLPNDNILIVADPAMYYEWSGSIRFYLKDELDRKNLFIYALPRKSLSSYSKFYKGLIKHFGSRYGNNRYKNIKDKGMIDDIILFPRMEKTFIKNFYNTEVLKKNFIRKKVNGYVIYYKNRE